MFSVVHDFRKSILDIGRMHDVDGKMSRFDTNCLPSDPWKRECNRSTFKVNITNAFDCFFNKSRLMPKDTQYLRLNHFSVGNTEKLRENKM